MVTNQPVEVVMSVGSGILRRDDPVELSVGKPTKDISQSRREHHLGPGPPRLGGDLQKCTLIGPFPRTGPGVAIFAVPIAKWGGSCGNTSWPGGVGDINMQTREQNRSVRPGKPGHRGSGLTFDTTWDLWALRPATCTLYTYISSQHHHPQLKLTNSLRLCGK